MFNGCRAIKSLSLPEGFGQEILYAENMFKTFGDRNLILSLPAAFGENITDASYMFYNYLSHEYLCLPNGFGGNITEADHMFAFALPMMILFNDGFGKEITTAEYMFANSDVQILCLPSSFGLKVTNAYCMFVGCRLLTKIEGFLALGVSFSLAQSEKLTHESLLNVLNSIQTVSIAQTLTLGTTNLEKLTDEEKAIATEKGWTLA